MLWNPFTILVVLIDPCAKERGIFFKNSIFIFFFNFFSFLNELNWCVFDKVP